MRVRRKQYFTACAAIFNADGKILLTRRHHPSNPQIHNHWQFPGGGVEFGEHPRETTLREIFEETGLTIKLISDHPLIYSHVFKGEYAHVVLFVYVATVLSGTVDTSHDHHETNGAEWFTRDEVLKLQSLPETDTIARDAFNLYISLPKVSE